MFKKNTTKSQFAKIIAVNILFLILIAGYFFVFYRGHQKNDRILSGLVSIKEDLNELKKLQNEFIAGKLFDDDFFETGENKYTHKLDEYLNQISDKIKELHRLSISYDNDKILLYYDNLEENLNRINVLNNLLLKYLKESGNERYGIYNHLLLTEQSCLERMADLPAESVIKKYFEQAKSYREIFYHFNDLKVLALANASIDAGIKQIEQRNLAANYKYLRVLDQLNEYKKVFNLFARKKMQIGLNRQQGLRYNLSNNYKRTDREINLISDEIKHISKRSGYYTFFIVLFLLAVDIFLSYYFHAKTTHKITTFIKEEENYFKSWLKGVTAQAPVDLPNDDYSELQKLMNDFSGKLNLSVQMLKALLRSDPKLLSEENFDKAIFTEIKAIDKHIRSLNRQLKAETNATLVNEWIRKGLTGFSEVLRKNFDEPVKHAKEILSNLVAYLNVPMGAIYLPSTEKRNTYDLVGSIAFGKEKHYVRSVALGEGIVGTVAKERKTLNITDIPDDYFRVSSGFGEAKPKNIIVIPIKLESKVFGIIELASLQKFQHFELEFIDELSKTLGASFAISRIFRNTRNKLEKTENRVMELRREKRKSDLKVKELEKENQELKNIRQENETLNQSIDTLMLVAELDTEGNIVDINNAFVELFKKSKEHLLHSNYWDYTFIRESIENDIALDKYKNSLRMGKILKLDQHFILVKKDIFLSSVFVPFKDLNGKVYKIKVIAWNNSNLVNIENELEKLRKSLENEQKSLNKQKFIVEEIEKKLQEKDKEIAAIRTLYEEDIKKIKAEHVREMVNLRDEYKHKEIVLLDQIATLQEEIKKLKS